MKLNNQFVADVPIRVKGLPSMLYIFCAKIQLPMFRLN